MRKIMDLLLVLVLCLGLASPGMAADGDFEIENGVLIHYRGSDANVVIPDGVVRIELNTFSNVDNKNITSITIPASVNDIAESAFSLCDNLTAIYVDEENPSYLDIDGVLFSKDMTLLHTYPQAKQGSTYSIPDGVTTIGTSAFRDCPSLTDIIIPESVTVFGGMAFSGTPWLEQQGELVIVNGVLLDYQGSGGNVVIPDSVTVIGDSAFQQCEVEKVHIPDSVTRIEEGAFWGSDLTEIIIPSGITKIGLIAFDGCLNLPAIQVDPENPNYMGIDGVLFSKDGTQLLTYPAGRQADSYSIPDSVTEIGECAFSYASVSSVHIPNSVTVIRDDAFSCCKNLTDITIPDSVTDIGGWTFVFCEKLTHINLPNSVTSLGDHAFLWCDSLTDITIPGSITRIQEGTFTGCENLTDVTILPGVASIEKRAFLGCKSLENITIPDSVTQIGESAFDGARGNISNVYYSGSEEQWNAIHMGAFNHRLTNAAIHYNCPISVPDVPTVPELPDTPAVPTTPTAPIIIAAPMTTTTPVVIEFADVKPADYFSDAVTWAVGKNILTGTSDTTFSPHDRCTTAEILTFLWRAKGEPGTSIDNPFSDVSTSDYYYKAALWAYENGLVSGVSFNGDAPCTRAQTVTYQWKLAGSPAAPAANFTDVSTAADYAGAVAWAVQKGVTAGTSDTTFSPSDTCTRGQIVTFLYRDLA